MTLSVDRLTPEVWNSLSGFPKLESLYLSGIDHIELEGMCPLVNLKTLTIGGGTSPDFHRLPGLNAIPNLVVTDHSATTLEVILKQAEAVRELTLDAITGLEVDVASRLSHIEQLEALTFGQFTMGEPTSDAWSRAWSGFTPPPMLREGAVSVLFQRAINLRRVGFWQLECLRSEVMQRMLSNLPNSIEEVSFGWFAIVGNETSIINVLAQKRVAQLELFEVCGLEITELSRISSLRELKLSNRGVRGKQLGHLFANIPQLERVQLNIPFCEVSADTLLEYVRAELDVHHLNLTAGINCYGVPCVVALRS